MAFRMMLFIVSLAFFLPMVLWNERLAMKTYLSPSHHPLIIFSLAQISSAGASSIESSVILLVLTAALSSRRYFYHGILNRILPLTTFRSLLPKAFLSPVVSWTELQSSRYPKLGSHLASSAGLTRKRYASIFLAN
jgi:hypothetical protein